MIKDKQGDPIWTITQKGETAPLKKKLTKFLDFLDLQNILHDNE